MLIMSSFFIRHKKIIFFSIGAIILATFGLGYFINGKSRTKKTYAAKPLTSNAVIGNITTSITGNGTIASASTKLVASEVSADVKEVRVSVGDKVSKGDILFVLDDTELNSKIRSIEKSISNQNKNLAEYKKDISNLNVYATTSGYVSNFSLSLGDSVTKNSVIFNTTDNDVYIFKALFNYNKNAPIYVGDSVSLMLVGNFLTLTGEVSYISDEVTLSEIGTPLKEVEITIKNPGYTVEGVEAIATIIRNDFSIRSYSSSKFEKKESSKFRVLASGTIKSVNIRNGDYINTGDLIMVLENEDLQDNYQTSKENISDLYEDLADVKGDTSFYTITSPIDGVVTTLNVSEGDYVRAESSLAKIVNNYDVEFEIDVDELDILDIKIGQEVKIIIDAISKTEKEPIIGKVSEIALEGTSMNSVTTYPVTISFEGNDNIKMGMNCSAEIIIENKENILLIPVEAINTRKNKYYVTLENGEEREVETGIYDEDNIEIVSGLSEGDSVILPQLVKGSSSENNRKEANSFGGFGGMGGGQMPMNMGGLNGRGSMQNGGMPRM